MMHAGCWTCQHQQIGGHLTFLGNCRWFPAHGKGDAKAIPPRVVDVGCKLYVHEPTRYWATHEVTND